MVLNSEYDIRREKEFIHMAIQFNFSGVFLLTAQSEEIEKELDDIEIPVVLVNRILGPMKGIRCCRTISRPVILRPCISLSWGIRRLPL